MTNTQKTPLSRTLPAYVQGRAAAAIAQRWVSLPCEVTAVNATGTQVTVAFKVQGMNLPPATMAVTSSKYIRSPIKVGDMGRARSSSAYIGEITGLGTGNPAAAGLQPNLSELVWEPVSNSAWSGNPDNAVFTDASGNAVMTLSATGVSLAFGGHEIVITSSGVTIDGKDFLTHQHAQPPTGTGTYTVSGSTVNGDSGAVV
jgi:hypothetical protein